LEEYLEDFLALFFPAIHADIDWTRGVTFLDKELQQVAPEAELGRRIADKLVQVWLRSRADMWVLVHIEVQNQKDRDFARRMFIYFYRIYDRFERQVVSLAVLGDERATWRPARYTMGLWGCSMRFTYPIVKLRDYQARREELEASQNPFATVVLAHLAAQDTRRNVVRRQQAKLALTRRLYERGYSRARVLSLFRFIDWVLQLPSEQERAFWQEIRAYEEERQSRISLALNVWGWSKAWSKAWSRVWSRVVMKVSVRRCAALYGRGSGQCRRRWRSVLRRPTGRRWTKCWIVSVRYRASMTSSTIRLTVLVFQETF